MCRRGHPLADGGYDDFLQVVKLPGDGVINAAYDSPEYDSPETELLWPGSVITIDNTPTKVVESDDGSLVQVLPAGTCTLVQVEVRTSDLGNLVVGFAHTTIPFGEWRPNGGFTRLQEKAEATSFQFQWYVN